MFPELGSDGKASACNAGDLGSNPGSGRSPGQEDPLEKEKATHSSILAWKIPWTEVPGGLQSMGSVLLYPVTYLESCFSLVCFI